MRGHTSTEQTAPTFFTVPPSFCHRGFLFPEIFRVLWAVAVDLVAALRFRFFFFFFFFFFYP
jgi:hypothetical protein